MKGWINSNKKIEKFDEDLIAFWSMTEKDNKYLYFLDGINLDNINYIVEILISKDEDIKILLKDSVIIGQHWHFCYNKTLNAIEIVSFDDDARCDDIEIQYVKYFSKDFKNDLTDEITNKYTDKELIDLSIFIEKTKKL